MNYKQKLLDPRWQRRRLQILQRDDFRCTSCGNADDTLHVHHFAYGVNPWDVDDKHLTTLCSQCHEYEHKHREQAEKVLLSAIRKAGFLAGSLDCMAEGFEEMQPFHAEEVMASVFKWFLQEPQIMNRLCDMFFEHLSEKQEETKVIESVGG